MGTIVAICLAVIYVGVALIMLVVGGKVMRGDNNDKN